MMLLKIADGFEVSILEQLLRVMGAALLGAVFGFEREMKHKPAGFITFMLVSMGSCLFALLQINMKNMEGNDSDAGRIIAQVVSGIGFLGAGTIIHNKGSVKGITTAALLWVSAAIGLLIGIGGINNYLIAICATVFFFPLSLVSRRFSRKIVASHRVNRIFIVFEELYEEQLYKLLAENGAIVKKTFFHSKQQLDEINIKEVFIYFSATKKKSANDIIEILADNIWIHSIEEV